MIISTASPVLGRLLKPLASRMRPDMLLAYANLAPDEAEQNRYEELASKSTEGTLTAAERQELEAIVHANSVLSAIKTEAMLALAEARPA